jgi:hypothetical protein
LAADHLEEAIPLNPMRGVDVSLTPEEKTEGHKRKKAPESAWQLQFFTISIPACSG